MSFETPIIQFPILKSHLRCIFGSPLGFSTQIKHEDRNGTIFDAMEKGKNDAIYNKCQSICTMKYPELTETQELRTGSISHKQKTPL